MAMARGRIPLTHTFRVWGGEIIIWVAGKLHGGCMLICLGLGGDT